MENQNVEYKLIWKDEYLKWICGFANADGGKIYIGVNDNGNVVGVENIKSLLEEIPNKVQTNLGIVVSINVLNKNDKEYIEIVVSPQMYPVNYKGEYYIRSGSTKQELRGNALTQFLALKTGIKWEDVVIENVSVEDLDKESFDIFKREAVRTGRMTKTDLNMSNREILDSLNLMVGDKITRAGVMLFHRTPDKWVLGCYTKVGKFGKGADLQFQDEIKGSLFLQAERVIEIIYLKYLKADISYENVTRVERYPYPKDAVREGLYNALIHSNYQVGSPIQIRIDDESLTISNDCILPSEWTEKTLFETHKSIQNNPHIASAFYRAGLVEIWGRGIQKIVESCEAYDIDKPIYKIHPQDIMMILKNKSSNKVPDKVSNKVSNEILNEPLNETINEKEKEIMQVLKEYSTITLKELCDKTNISLASIKRIISSLQKRNIIERQGSKKTGKWVVK